MYRKSGLLITCLLIITSTFAQMQKGDFLIGAGTNLDFSSLSSQYSNDSYESDILKTNSFELNSRLGYFLANNFAVGLDLLKTNETEKEDGDVYKTNAFAVGPFARLYFGTSNVKPFIHSGLGFGNTKIEYEFSNIHYSDDSVKSSLLTFDIGGGVSFILSPKVALELGISYGNANSKFTNHYNEETTNKIKGIGSNLGISILL